MARQTPALSQQQRDVCVQVIRDGGTDRAAFGSAAISESTFYDWMKRGEDLVGQTKLTRVQTAQVQFLEDIKKARAEAEIRAMRVIQVAMAEHWQAAAWYLERRYPGQYGRREVVEHAGELRVKGYVNVSPEDFDDELTEEELSGVGAGANGSNGSNGRGGNGSNGSGQNGSAG